VVIEMSDSERECFGWKRALILVVAGVGDKQMLLVESIDEFQLKKVF
jgi:hypothetical protein